MFSIADLSLAAEKMRKNQLVTGGFLYYFTKSQAASCKHFSVKIAALGSLNLQFLLYQQQKIVKTISA
jgi:hypothetical protein